MPVVDARQRIQARSKPAPETGCWIWTGAKYLNGYGALNWRGRKFSPRGAHRESYEAFIGPIPDGMLVLHKCDVKACVNPDHLFLGTYQDNVDDMFSKGRNPSRKGHLNGRSLARKAK